MSQSPQCCAPSLAILCALRADLVYARGQLDGKLLRMEGLEVEKKNGREKEREGRKRREGVREGGKIIDGKEERCGD